ncbi:LPS export ABC transporter periplasmic protein LptC [Salinisphaera sp.]|uniref:LPS export ABC transporter periplasmic protein LptC n=1 Tax=Salinisphaera sp. TaxID=1914330 RepID=UPI002D79E6BB|nr:LPS export ABC transporter periplasmic protein LptC [Salinisphaera sp.]HET7315155.1 LPS export ABC transporter periplasmic protein LptC [Salinisphaera sp.]
MRRIGAILAIACLVLIGLGVWIGSNRHTAAEPEPVRTPDNSDYYMQGATVYQMSPRGQLAYRMQVAQTLHFADGSARLSDIDVHYLEGTQTYWNLHADKGRVPAGQRDLYLYGGVIIHHPRKNGNMVKVTTPHAWVHPKANRIKSDAHVTAIEPGRKITGDGMRINLDTNKLNLLDNVHVTYTP